MTEIKNELKKPWSTTSKKTKIKTMHINEYCIQSKKKLNN